MPRKIHAKSTQNSRSFRIQAAGAKINFCGQDLVALSRRSLCEPECSSYICDVAKVTQQALRFCFSPKKQYGGELIVNIVFFLRSFTVFTKVLLLLGRNKQKCNCVI